MTVYATPHYIIVWIQDGKETHQVVDAPSHVTKLVLHNENAPAT